MWLLKSKRRHIRSETLNEYLDGRLSGNELSKVQSRLQACDTCQEELEELRATIAVVRQMPMEQSRRSFVMDAPPPQPVPARQSFHVRAPAWAYAGAASIAVVALAVLVAVDATGGLSPAAESPKAVVATAPQNRAVAPQAAATSVASPQAAAAPTQDQEPQVAAVAEAVGTTSLTNQPSQAPKGDGAEAAESTIRRAAQGGDDSDAFTVTTAAALSDSAAVEESGSPSVPAENAASSLPEPAQAPAPAIESAPAAEIAAAPGGTSNWWRVLEGVAAAAAAAVAFVAVLVWARRSSRN